MTTLILTDVTARYGRLAAVDRLSLTVTGPGCHCLVGANGAGKSTLLAIIAGTRPTTSGRIDLDGVAITHRSPQRRHQLGVSRTFQTPRPWPELTALDNIVLAQWRHSTGRTRRWCTPHAATSALRILDQVGLGAHARIVAAQLAHGQQRLLDIAIAIASQPRLLLLDEPTAGLADSDLDTVVPLIHSIAATTAVVLVEHHLDIVARLADRITVLDHGHHLATGTFAELADRPDVTARYPLLAGAV